MLLLSLPRRKVRTALVLRVRRQHGRSACGLVSNSLHLICCGHRERSARVQVVQQPVQGDASSDEEDEETQEEIEDSQILEDLPDETEVRGCAELNPCNVT